MADDTRQPSGKAAKQPILPPENANMMPGGTNNTAGGKMKEATLGDAVKSIKPSDFLQVHEKPCVRESLLTGIGAGFGVGSLRAILGGGELPAFPVGDRHANENVSIGLGVV